MSSNGTVSRRQKPPQVVAELGRPETPDETAARKAENSRKYRANKTINNLWLSLIVCVAVVIVIVLLVPRDNTSHLPPVDYRSIASSAQAAFPVPVASPDLPSTWSANAAEIRSSTGATAAATVPYWYIGLVTPSNAYIGLEQAVTTPTNGGTDAWLAEQLHDTAATDTVTIDGVQWTVYDNRQTPNDVGNASYALSTQSGATTYVLLGTATTEEFTQVAESITPNIQSQPATAVVGQ
ncbi:DUF4245 domain-containing protein [Subtercola lobariae]|uniref:DUF4245 domain-containing protein n=1 Tax=Subtercola lobariae TaxID=1588641 RepID=A0A917B9R1_9MICO|nr:DUF4245 domain-containing protein [Subtercola lobariae]GGF27223.1 hypothetical protein GCM10011399_20660 [Subtercola lobariae]